MTKDKTTLRQDMKTMWVDGCKELVGWLSSFGKPKLPLDGMMKKPKRARGKKGKYLADDPTTAYTNEAWVGGKAPKKKSKKK